MRVQQSEIRLASSHVLAARTESRSSMRAWVDGPAAASTRASEPVPARKPSVDAAVPGGKACGSTEAQGCGADEDGLSPKDAQKVRLIEALIEFLTGRKVKIRIWNGKPVDGASEAGSASEAQGGGASGSDPSTAPARAGWGAQVDVERSSWESETLTFAAQGKIKTADGRTIEFEFGMGMRRESFSSSSLSLSLGDARKKDPLVVDLGGSGIQLTDSATPFDLDGDGSTENVHFATGSSAFLALDRGTGTLDGSSLFGTATGDGFGELARLDSDGNGWIDSGDPAWADLRLWSRDEAGVDHVRRIDGSGIGAISLATASTPFSLRDAADSETGSMTETGVWIGESGRVGAVSHVDLVV